jgi:hypothetical protein
MGGVNGNEVEDEIEDEMEDSLILLPPLRRASERKAADSLSKRPSSR